MTVFVDDLRSVGKTRRGLRFAQSCHMMADDPHELDYMRQTLGLRSEWIHGDHYDLSPTKRILAVKHGAKTVSSKRLVWLRRRNRVNT